MDAIETALQSWQLHPVADHFTIAILTVAIVTEVVASLLPARQWLRNMAVGLMVVGALAAWASYATGDIETDRVWKMLSPEVQEALASKAMVGQFFAHAALGLYLAVVFAVLALWRLGLGLFNFIAGTRTAYLTVAVAALALLLYQGHTGGKLVYTYGVGTGSMAPGAPTQPLGPSPAAAAPTAQPTAPAPEAIPAAPAASSTPAASATVPAEPSATPPAPTAAPTTAGAASRAPGVLILTPAPAWSPSPREGAAGPSPAPSP